MMSSLVAVLSLAVAALLSCATLVTSFSIPPPGRPIANHIRSLQPPGTPYPGLTTTTYLTQYTILEILHNASLVGNSHNFTYVFNTSFTHIGHMPWLAKQMNTTGGDCFTVFLPDDSALFEAKGRWQALLQEKLNITLLDLSTIWNSTEPTGNTTVDKAMEWTHAGIAWSIVQGNYSLHNLSTDSLLPTMLYPNITKFEPFVRLGNNHSQFIRIIKGDNVTVYGIPILNKFPEMTHTNRTDVMIVSGSGNNLYQIGHVYREILAKNGRIYIMDRAVDFPFNTTDVLKSENATLFLKGISKSGFNDTVNLTSNMTILVPTDSAIYHTMKYYAITNDTKQKWTPEHMKAILTPYIVNGTYYGKDLNHTSSLTSIGGHVLPITHIGNQTLFFGNVSVIQFDVLTMNGVVHIINDTFRTLEKQIIDTLPK